MSQPTPPPGNPFAAGQAPYPPAPAPAPARNNVALGLVVALVAALVAAVAYGAIGGAIEREIGYAAVGVGFLVGFAAAKVGGRNPALPVIAAILSVGAVYLGQLVVIAVIFSNLVGGSAPEILLEDFGTLTDAWKEAADGMTYLFLALAAVTAFAGAKKANS
ncbi:hypothetical protein [Streptomyces sp. CB03238]|uniref:hypothetical protein n=1 Tax=Streptomyces sp. CB03238 TaxID=1907777 RepID=UPI000A0F66F0|nr:hypothetical protein [Streptomyces sp. CB03238]ORT59598.1 hypothetical protein BKD26_11865 [Streptomyces sp. CB03238]